MRKKIALMTWHHVTNYGTALQALALKKTIENMGCEVDLIEYRRKGEAPLRKRNVLSEIRQLLHRKKYIPSSHFFHDYKKSFQEFYADNFTYTDKCEYNQDFQQLCLKYDAFVCGSDQIWGPEWLDARYFLDFVPESCRKIAYAPSIGVSVINDKNVEETMTVLLKSFTNLSVREATGCKIVKEMTGLNAINVSDPVLLLNAQEWEEMLIDSRNDDKYVLIFFLKKNEVYFSSAMKIAANMGIKVKIFHCTQSEDNAYANIDSASPQEFLTLIHDASYVCTDSFHVMMFSIIFNKQFTAYQKDAGDVMEKGSRMNDVLFKLGIQNTIVANNYEKGAYIDYEKVNVEIDKWREESYLFLKESLSQIPQIRYMQHMKSTCTMCKERCDDAVCSCVSSPIFSKRIQEANGWFEKQLMSAMRKWNFACKEECYGCKYFQKHNAGVNFKKPAFYYELLVSLDEKEMSVVKIYKEYYLIYDLGEKLKAVRKLIRKVIKRLTERKALENL